MKIEPRKHLILAGLKGPILFLVVLLLAGAFFPGYDHANDYISELGAVDSPVALFMNVFGFMLFGVFLALFSIGFFLSPEIGTLGRMAAPLFFISGILIFFVGVYPCDAGCINVTATEGWHEFFSNTPFITMTIALILTAIDAARRPKLRILTPIILVLGLVTLYFAYFYILAEVALPMPGIIQRLAIGVPFFLVALIAWKIYRVQQ